MIALATISLSGVVWFLLALCVLALLIWGTRYVLGLMGVVVPSPSGRSSGSCSYSSSSSGSWGSSAAAPGEW